MASIVTNANQWSSEVIPRDGRQILGAMYAFMCRQRRIKRKPLAEAMGLSVARVNEILQDGPRTHMTQDRLERAIDTFTERAGGLLAATGSTQAGLDAFRGVVDEAAAADLLGPGEGRGWKIA